MPLTSVESLIGLCYDFPLQEHNKRQQFHTNQSNLIDVNEQQKWRQEKQQPVLMEKNKLH